MSIISDFRQMIATIEDIEADAVDADVRAFVLTLEDKRFYTHAGVDLMALARAAFSVCRGRANGGASTIDMQFVRTLTDRRERTLRRKLREMVFAVLVRRRFGATRVLEAYLTTAVTGTDLNGVEAVSAHLFGVPAAKCTKAQKAVLGSTLLVPAPSEPTEDWWRRIAVRGRSAERRVVQLRASEILPRTATRAPGKLSQILNQIYLRRRLSLLSRNSRHRRACMHFSGRLQ